MGVTRPEFIRVVPGEVERYGANAALVLAHIRYRCDSDGPGRVMHRGVRHWRVSYADLARETGLNVSACRWAIENKLGAALSSKHLPPLNDMSRAYAVTSQMLSTAAQDQPTAADDSPAAADDSPAAADNSPAAADNSPAAADNSCTTYREAGEGGEGGGSAGDGTGAAVLVDPANEQKQLQRYCSRHMPDGTDAPCGACCRRREAFDRWTAAASAAESARRREAATARVYQCGNCFDTGTVRNSNGVPVKGRPRCHHDGTWSATMASDQGMA